MKLKTIEEINQYKSKTINPLKTPNEWYELYSVPNYEFEHPEIVQGKDIASSKQIVEKGDILISKINPRINRVWIVGNFSNHMKIASSEWIVIRNKEINTKYLSYYFKTDKFKNLMTSQVTGIGGSLTRAQPKNVKGYEVPLFSDSYHKKVSKALDKTNELLKLRQSQITALDELTQSLFLEMFGDPQTNKNNYLIEPLTKFYEHPKDAVKCGPFGSALKKEEFVQDGIPVWNMDNITKQNEFIDCPKLFVTEEKSKQLKNYDVQNGDIIISRAGTVGKMSVVDSKYESSLISTNLIRLRLNEKLKPEFLVWLIKIFGDKVCRMRTGNDGAFSHMNTSVLNNIYFPYPPLEKQQEFLNKLIAIKNQKESFNKSLREIETLYNALLQKAFKGELFQDKV